MDNEILSFLINYLYDTKQISDEDYKKWILSEDNSCLPKLIKK